MGKIRKNASSGDAPIKDINTNPRTYTILFTDIENSTPLWESHPQRMHDLAARHDFLIQEAIEANRGQVVKTTGDGFHAVFDGPARAIQCGCAIRDAVEALNVSIRIGLHTGECELVDSEVEGLAVHIAARVAATAGPGEVLVSRTVKDLVAGSGLSFSDRGEHVLKGIPDKWQLFAVTDGATSA